jgi:hypothetical protein
MNRDMNISNIAQDLDRMLGTYDNLWIDLSWVVYDLCLVHEGKPSQEWVDLVEKYPDRFMIGSDAIGHFQDYSQTIGRYYIFLDALSPSTAQKVARTNFINVLSQKIRNRI